MSSYSNFLAFISNVRSQPYNSQNTANINRRNFENLLGYNNGDLRLNFMNHNAPPGPNYKNNRNFYNALIRKNKAAMYRLANFIYNNSRN